MRGKAGTAPPERPVDLYVVSGLSLEAIAAKLAGHKGCSLRQLERVSSRDDWAAQRRKHVGEVTAQVRRASAETEAQMRTRLLTSYKGLGGVARGALAKIHDRIAAMPVVTRDDATSLRAVAATLRIAHEGERELVDPKDDRVSSIFTRAAEVADGRIDEIDDWTREEELTVAMAPRAMIDLSYSTAPKRNGDDHDAPVRPMDDFGVPITNGTNGQNGD